MSSSSRFAAARGLAAHKGGEMLWVAGGPAHPPSTFRDKVSWIRSIRDKIRVSLDLYLRVKPSPLCIRRQCIQIGSQSMKNQSIPNPPNSPKPSEQPCLPCPLSCPYLPDLPAITKFNMFNCLFLFVYSLDTLNSGI
jgi:hypothetical protein